MAGEQNIQSAVLTDRRPQISELAQKTQKTIIFIAFFLNLQYVQENCIF